MKVRIDLDSEESLDEAEENLYKALKGKRKAKEELGERYVDPMVNEFHDLILSNHLEVLEEIKDRVVSEVKRVVSTG